MLEGASGGLYFSPLPRKKSPSREREKNFSIPSEMLFSNLGALSLVLHEEVGSISSVPPAPTAWGSVIPT